MHALNHLPAMIAYWDHDGRNMLANAAYVEWFGKSPAQLRGEHIRELLGAELYASNLPYITGALAGVEQLFERTLIDTAGRTRYTQAQYLPDIDPDGQVRGFFVLVTDITQRVQAESSLQHTRTTVALQDDRQRIAADLHDIVIQRLFAAALRLSSLEAQLAGDQQALIRQTVDDLDESVTALREAIIPLRRKATVADPHREVTKLIESASELLGFAPSLYFDDPPELISHTVLPELLAVLREALTNTAKHAHASAVDVSIGTLGNETRLQVKDNGQGIGETARSSGLSNICQRAARLGGTASILSNHPSGTVVDWRIPTTTSGGTQPREPLPETAQIAETAT